MKKEILTNLDNPAQLERLYRADKPNFKQEFQALFPEPADNKLVSFWHERLKYTCEKVSVTGTKDLIFVFVAALVAGFLAKIPAILPINEEFFYPRNIGFIIFPVLSAYFAWKNKLSRNNQFFVIVSFLAGLIFINSLPDVKESDTLVLSCIHILLFLWCITGFAFVGGPGNKSEKRLAFLRFNGDLLVISTLILIAAGIMTAITIGLFDLIGFDIEDFYFEHIAIFALPAVPIAGTYLIKSNPQLVGKISPVIARIFSPIVLVMLVIYLVAIVYSGKDPYSDRDFLIMFNLLLVGVMAIIFFSIAETSKKEQSRSEIWVLLLLSAVTIVVNGIALSAILFRISEWGITPNRVAVLGGNLLILGNLLMVTIQLYKVLSTNAAISEVGKAISLYLPFYFFWTVIVAFFFPVLFEFE